MTRLLTTGFETGDVNELGTSTTQTNSTLTAVSSSPSPRAGGAYCLKCAVTASGTNATYKTFTWPTAKSEVWVRFAIYINVTSASPPNGTAFAILDDSASGAQTCLHYDFTTSLINARTGQNLTSGLLASSSQTMSRDTWHVIDWRVQITSSTVGVVEVWLDGAQVINFSGDNTATTTLNVKSLRLGQTASYTSAGTSMYWAFDDLAVNDTSGTINNGRPGDGRVVLLVPNGAGSNTGLSRGGTDTGANWSQTSELPPSLSQYVFGATAALRDTYALGDLPVTPASINVVEVLALAQNNDAGAGSLGLTVKSGSTTNEGSAQALSTTAAYFRQQYETDPNTSVAWTAAAVNALEAGVTVR